jgi:hypothetical protein
MLGLLGEVVALGRAEQQAEGRHAALKRGLLAIYLDSLVDHGCKLDADTVARLLAMDIELNAQGMACWLDRAN